MNKTRLNKLFLTVLLVVAMLSLTSVYLVPDVKANPTLEDYTAYTEVDAGGKITIVNSTYLDMDGGVAVIFYE